jgi:phage terminase small subunit
MKKAALSPKQQAFVDAYLSNGKNAGKAAITAGYSRKSAETNGPRLLRNAQIKAAVSAATKKASEKCQISFERWLEEYLCVGLLDPKDVFEDDGSVKQIKDMPEHARRAISSVKVVEMFDGQGEQKQAIGLVKEIRFHPKLQALRDVGEALGFLKKDKIEIPGLEKALYEISEKFLPKVVNRGHEK